MSRPKSAPLRGTSRLRSVSFRFMPLRAAPATRSRRRHGHREAVVRQVAEMNALARRLPLVTGGLVVAGLVGCGGVRHEFQSGVPQSRPVHSLVDQSRDPRELDLNDLVPSSGRIRHVWYVAAGRTVPEVVVGWSYRARHRVPSTPSNERYALTLWHPAHLRANSARWTPHTLVPASPFAFSAASVRTADVTGDGHPDLLVTVECQGCNHAVAAVSVFADIGRRIQRIYGHGFVEGSKDGSVGVRGRQITETAWGARGGLVWFDEPRGGSSVCCWAQRLQTFLRWHDGRWTLVKLRTVSAGAPYLDRRPVPLGMASSSDGR